MGIKLHTVVISYQRLSLLIETIETYEATVTLPYKMIVVDNGSDKEVTDWIEEHAMAKRFDAILIGENRYPGYAANRGFETTGDATHLHRSDSDMRYLPDWCKHFEREFHNHRIGLVGLRTIREERYTSLNTGGTAVIRRDLWDNGLRYNEKPWHNSHTEDWEICQDVIKMGSLWGRVRKPSVVHLGSGDLNDEYYRKSFGVRGIA